MEDMPREQTHNMVLRQVGWIGASGRLYGLSPTDALPQDSEPGGFAPLYWQTGVWELLDEPCGCPKRPHDHYIIKD